MKKIYIFVESDENEIIVSSVPWEHDDFHKSSFSFRCTRHQDAMQEAQLLRNVLVQAGCEVVIE